MLLTSVKASLHALKNLLSQLSAEDYSKPCQHLSNASIGEHTRHIIEMFQCLESSYESGMVNYDDRKRDIKIQTEIDFAFEKITEIENSIRSVNKKMSINYAVNGETDQIESNYFRELLYNLEHCVHHQALIKVAVLQCKNVIVDDDFGVAQSTIEYRNQCAQ